MDDNGQWLSIADAARQLGVTRQAIQGKIKRGTIEHRQDNRGNPIVRIATSIAPSIGNAMGAMPIAPSGPGESVPVAVMREMLDRQERQHAAAMTALRADKDAELARLTHAHQAGVNALMAKVAALLVERRERRPWWKWW